jgi:hypothetical protein
MTPTPLSPNQVHVRENTVTIECSSPRAAVELAERLLHAKPVAYVTLQALARLIADDTAVTQATGRAVASEQSIGLFAGPQASARKQAFEECLAVCEKFAAETDAQIKSASHKDDLMLCAISGTAGETAKDIGQRIRSRMEGK